MWYAKNSASSGQGIVIDEQTGRSVAVAYDVKDTALLAAAPELLAALETAENALADALEGGDYWRENAAEHDLPKIRAAIAKATGQ